jgi:hypothetical protein
MTKYYCNLCGDDITELKDFCLVSIQTPNTDDEWEICKGCYSVIDDCISKLRTEVES